MGNLRITGLATGLDVDNTVKQMMKAHIMKVDKLKQDRQLVQWRQDLYRELIGSVNTFRSTYFDVLKPEKYMLSSRNFSNYTITNSSLNPSVKITTTSGVTAGDYKVTVNKLAEAAKITGATCINIEEGTNNPNLPTQITDSNNTMTIETTDGNYNITLDKGNYYLQDLVSHINTKLASTDNGDISGKVKAVLSAEDNSIKLVGITEINDTNKTLTINISGQEHTIELTSGKYTFEELASQINSKLSLAGINSKLKVEVPVGGRNISFIDLTGGGDTITVNTLDIEAPECSSIYSMTLNLSNAANETAENKLSYTKDIITGFNDTLSLKIDGVSHTITLPPLRDIGGAVSMDTFIGEINKSLESSGINNEIKAQLSLDKTKIQFVSNSNKTITISGNASKSLGFADSFELSQSIDDKMSTLLGGSTEGRVEFTINNGVKDITFRYDFNSSRDVTEGDEPNKVTIIGAKDKTISQIIDDISTEANVKLSYSQLSRKFSLESTGTGSAQSISISDASGGGAATKTFLTNLFGGCDNLKDIGQDAEVSITNPNGETSNVIKSANSFTIDGVNYSLINPDKVENTINLTANTQGTFDKIKEFVDKYNETIDKIYQKIGEKRQYKFPPLTDDQKKDMKEDEIKKWEEKAKEGLLANDSTLENMLSRMRRAFFDSVPGADISLKEIGISTSSDISQRGKIIIDEAKLQDALKNNGDKVAQLFTKTSSTSYVNGGDNSSRYLEEGIFQRINDIFQDNLRTTRDSNGKKGILLEKAGIKGDYSEFHNLISDQLVKKDKVISEMEKKLTDKENKYYLQFAQLEKAMQKMNDQSNWLSQQLGSMGGR